MFLFPQATEMFQFAQFPHTWLYIHQAARRHAPAWVSPFGHLRLLTVAHTSPELFAVYRVLHRRLTPQAFTVRPCSFSTCVTEKSFFSRSFFFFLMHLVKSWSASASAVHGVPRFLPTFAGLSPAQDGKPRWVIYLEHWIIAARCSWKELSPSTATLRLLSS